MFWLDRRCARERVRVRAVEPARRGGPPDPAFLGVFADLVQQTVSFARRPTT